MRLLGIVMFVVGSAGVAFSIRNTLEQGRPRDVGFALLAWLTVIIALLGLALIFVPNFLS